MSDIDLCWKAAQRLRTLNTNPELHDFYCAVAHWLDREGNLGMRFFGPDMQGAADPQAVIVAQAFLGATR